jgi:ubiquinone/menaquinone biosynthesis C-methylase UbiE
MLAALSFSANKKECTKLDQTDTRASFDAHLQATHRPAHARRTAALNARFFLPHLRPGMRLLDAGCGPGSITIGLAEAVAPGEAIGIDISDDALGTARSMAAERGGANVRFDVADIYALPFDNDTFDAAFSHCVMQHLEEPHRAIVELFRVLKPGGVIGVSDVDFDASVVAPEDDVLRKSWGLMAKARRNPYIGKHLRALLASAGFARCEAALHASLPVTDEAVKVHGEWSARYFEAPAFIAQAEAAGWSDERELRDIAAAWRAWAREPGAFVAQMGGWAVGFKPEGGP